jgi:hypothetical protein
MGELAYSGKTGLEENDIATIRDGTRLRIDLCAQHEMAELRRKLMEGKRSRL